MTKEDVRAPAYRRSESSPAIRVSSTQDAQFAAESIAGRAGIPIVELTMTVPGAIELIADLSQNKPSVIVGAGTVLDLETARRCLDAGAVLNQPRTGSSHRRIRAWTKCRGDPRRPDTHRSHDGVERRRRLRKGFSLLTARWCSLYQSVKGALSPRTFDCFRRCQSGDRRFPFWPAQSPSASEEP